PATRALMERIQVAVDPQLDAGFPGRRSARVEILLRDGRRFAHLQPNRKGDPELPLTDADLEGKLVEFAAPVIGADAARALAARLWTLETSETLP
ncbi:MAG TPA: MmgE/PrpD family protein, partial [Ramlibacter sp.]|nr:MmgE/PrpD family protein [Ramlibacter sp.]